MVTFQKWRKKNPSKPEKTPERFKIVRQSNKKPKPKVTKKKVTQSKCKRAFRRKSRKPITLNEYMPKEFRDESLMLITCYHIDGDVQNKDNIDKLAFEASQSSTIRISFTDKDLLLGFTSHNWPVFMVGYIRE